MIYLLISAGIIVIDQLAKYFVSLMPVGDTAFSAGLFDITYVQNEGAAFSMLSGRMSLLSVISIAFCAAVVVYWIKKKPANPLLCTAIMLLFSGALANAIDRIFRGFVVDFIRTTFINFPVFNIADMAITIGAGLIILYEILFDKEDKNGKADTNAD